MPEGDRGTAGLGRRSMSHPRYVAQLLAAKADEDRCCFISDGSQLGATVLYRGGRWHVIQHAENLGIGADAIALVTLDEEADPEKLTSVALATDFEDEALWLIDVRKFDELGEYGRSLKVLWRSDNP